MSLTRRIDLKDVFINLYLYILSLSEVQTIYQDFLHRIALPLERKDSIFLHSVILWDRRFKCMIRVPKISFDTITLCKH